MDTSTYLDEGTADYFGSDVSSVTDGRPEGFNDVSREDAYEESDTSSVTDGLIDGFNDRATDDDIGPDPEAIMQSVGEGGGGDVAATGPNTDLREGGSAAEAPKASSTPDEGSSSASDDSNGPEGEDDDADATGGDDADEDDTPDPQPSPEFSMSNTLPELQEAAREAGVSESGTKAEILERISNPHGA